jgi:REP element-mobilizing transposase RayT
MQSPLLAMGGTKDHVHLLLSLSKAVALSDLMLEIKRDTSKWMKEHNVCDFTWQDGYFAFSIGESGVDKLKEYIANQKSHHAALDYKDEMRTLFRRYRIDWDERYVWE